MHLPVSEQTQARAEQQAWAVEREQADYMPVSEQAREAAEHAAEQVLKWAAGQQVREWAAAEQQARTQECRISGKTQHPAVRSHRIFRIS